MTPSLEDSLKGLGRKLVLIMQTGTLGYSLSHTKLFTGNIRTNRIAFIIMQAMVHHIMISTFREIFHNLILAHQDLEVPLSHQKVFLQIANKLTNTL